MGDRAAGELRPLQLFNLAFGVAIGIGWIMVMGTWLGAAGPLGAATAFMAAGLAMLTIGYSYARVALDHSSAGGGEFAYARRAFGPAIGYWVGWFLALAYTVVIAFEIVSLGWISRELFAGLPPAPPPGSIDVAGLGIGCAVLLAVIGFNLNGTKAATRLQDVLVALKVAMSLGLVAGGLLVGDINNLEPLWGQHPSGEPLRGIVVVLAMAPFFYAGFGVVAQALGDVRAPRTLRALPRVMALVILGTMAFYILVILAAAAAAPRAIISGASFPAAAAFAHGFGSGFGAKAVLVLGVLGLLTMLNGLYFAAVRLIQALSQARLIPRTFGELHPRTGISTSTGVFIALAAIALAALGKTMLNPLLNVASASISGVMASVCAVLVHDQAKSGAPWRRQLVPSAGLALAATMVLITLYEVSAAAGPIVAPEWYTIAGWVAFGLLLRIVQRRFGHAAAGASS